jgi:hypothetical protein
MAFQLVLRTRTVMLMVSMCPESGFWDVPPGRGRLAKCWDDVNTASTP